MKSAEDILKEKHREPIWIDINKTVLDGLRQMNENRIGTVLIKENDRFVGIFSERDLLRNSVRADFDVKTARIGDFMSTPLRTAAHDTPLLKLTEMFLGLYIRHIVIEKGGRQIGMLSIGDVLRASLLEQDRQMKELNADTQWEYYDDWGWSRKRRG